MATVDNVLKPNFESGEPDVSKIDDSVGILKPLTFALNDGEEKWSEISDCRVLDCMVCPETFDTLSEFKQHLNLEHKIIIAETRKIAYLRGYALYWKKLFENRSYTEICSSFCVSSTFGNSGNGIEKFYLLSDTIPEDKAIREKLKRLRLESVLKQLEKERKDIHFDRICLCCSKEINGCRDTYFDHLSESHGLFLGHVNNIVFANQFLDLLDEKLNKKFECLYCEKIFKDGSSVKEHMRKKQHRVLNPKNSEFDQFYLINYLELDRRWEDILKEDDKEIQEFEDDSEELWGGGCTDSEMNIVCMFCNRMSRDAEIILLHMQEAHDFNLTLIRKTLKLNYYQQVKLVNYIRRQMYEKRCFNCLRTFSDPTDLQKHLTNEKHVAFIPDTNLFDQPQYYFPTYENDNLLIALYDDSPDDFMIESNDVIGFADMSVDSILWNESILRELR
ncbi:hypothetical protein CHUAL_010350 [Chamberlinius hualienensis]